MIWLVLATVSGALLFSFGQKTEDARHDIARLESQIRQEKQTIDILKAEWSYLNRPSRLRELAEKHLALDPPEKLPVIEPDFVALLDVPTPEEEPAPETETAIAVRTPPPAPPQQTVENSNAFDKTAASEKPSNTQPIEAESQDRASFALSVADAPLAREGIEAVDETIEAREPQKSFEDVLKSIGIE